MGIREKNHPAFVFLRNFRAVQQLIFCIVLALCVFGAMLFAGRELLLAIVVGWNSFSFFMIVVSWIIFFTTSSTQLDKRAKAQDESRYVTFIIVLISVAVTFFGTLILGRGLHILSAVASVALSWGLLHTIFTLRYAHLFYSGSLQDIGTHPGGLDFPATKTPDYLDFSYFSFVIGMTFQVSDVSITSPLIRRLALLHGLISFIFNTVIVALMINIIAGLVK